MMFLILRAREPLPSDLGTGKSRLKVGFLSMKSGSDDSPPPNVYNLKSSFDSRNPDGRAFTFGISREAYARVCFIATVSTFRFI